jgi:hypothetical protein
MNLAPLKSEPKKGAISRGDLQPAKPVPEAPVASATPPQPAPALPPPVTIQRAPTPVWGRDIH